MNHTDLYRYRLGFAFRGPLGPEGRQPAAADNGGCLAQGGAAKVFEEPLEMKSEEHGLRLLQVDSILHIYGCDQPRPNINLTRRVRPFLRVPAF